MKYLILFAFIAVVWWFWKNRNLPEQRTSQRRDPAAQKMLVCSHCGVHFPEDDGLSEGGKAYCSEGHRLAAHQADRR